MYLTIIIDQKDNKVYYPRSIAANECETFVFEKDYFDVFRNGTCIFPRHFKGLHALQNIRDIDNWVPTLNAPCSLLWIEGDKQYGFQIMSTLLYESRMAFQVQMSFPKDQRFLIVNAPNETPMLNMLVKGAKTLAQVKEVAYKHNFFLPEGWYEYDMGLITAKDVLRVRSSVTRAMFYPPKKSSNVQAWNET